MPTVSKKQEKFMQAVAHNPAGGYADGGMPMVMKDGQKVPAFAADGKGKMAKGGVAASKMGSVRTAAPSRDGVAMKGKTKGAMVKMAGSTKGLKKGGYC
jgi:hypothetical protein